MESKKIKVAIRCFTYNQEPYIRKCLDGFIMQKTSFHFVAVVHDDASTDGTTEIVQEYAAKYPEIIVPILERENQWSKHDGSLGKVMETAINSYNPEYTATCEGDDYWIDPLKLQKQVDAMESTPNASFCYTKNQCYTEKLKKITKVRGVECVDFRTFLLYDETITLTVLIRHDLEKKYNEEIRDVSINQNWLMGDTPLWLFLCKHGKVVTIDEVTAVYNAHQGSTSRTASYEQHKRFNKSALDIRLFFIEKYDDCRDLIPYLYDKYYRANLSDAYEFGNIIEFIKNFKNIKRKNKHDYSLALKLLPKALFAKNRN